MSLHTQLADSQFADQDLSPAAAADQNQYLCFRAWTDDKQPAAGFPR